MENKTNYMEKINIAYPFHPRRGKWITKMKKNIGKWGYGCFRYILSSEILWREVKMQITLLFLINYESHINGNKTNKEIS